jgi:hypothetical protein
MSGQVVQVQLAGAGRTYAYRWDGEPLRAGDWVMCPGNAVSPDGALGRVESFGREGYTGPLKDVLRRVEPPDPWEARMRAVRSRSEALRVYRAAQKAELAPERLTALVETGRAALAALR